MSEMSSIGDARDVTSDSARQLWRAGWRQVLPLQGSPWCRLLMNPVEQYIALVTNYAEPEPQVASFENISVLAYVDDGRDVLELRVATNEPSAGPLEFLIKVADELQRGTSVASAVTSALAAYRHLLTARPALSVEQQLGLFGELLLLEHLAKGVGARTALGCWSPPDEEHDFAAPSGRLEVKTTRREDRQHVISSINQLVPSPGSRLFLVSIQLTSSAPPRGRTLGQQVAQLRSVCTKDRPVLDSKLEDKGWRDGDADLYQDVLELRSRPVVILVDDDFPAITPSILRAAAPRSDLIKHVSYRIDVSTLTPVSPVPDELADFVTYTEVASNG